MSTTTLPHLFAGHVIPPLLRPLPALFVCAEHSKERPEPARTAFLLDVYRQHRSCLIALLEKAAELAGLQPSSWYELQERARALPEELSPGLAGRMEALDLELAHFSEVHRTALRQAYNMHPEVFRRVYRTHVPPWKVALVYSRPDDEQVPRLVETLSQRCYYDAKSTTDHYLAAMARWADMVLFAPRGEPLSPDAIAPLRHSTVPFLVLINLGTDLTGVDMDQVRLAALYQRNDIPVLHRPFPAIRLFQRIDRDLLLHRLQVAEKEPQRT